MTLCADVPVFRASPGLAGVWVPHPVAPVSGIRPSSLHPVGVLVAGPGSRVGDLRGLRSLAPTSQLEPQETQGGFPAPVLVYSPLVHPLNQLLARGCIPLASWPCCSLSQILVFLMGPQRGQASSMGHWLHCCLKDGSSVRSQQHTG